MRTLPLTRTAPRPNKAPAPVLDKGTPMDPEDYTPIPPIFRDILVFRSKIERQDDEPTVATGGTFGQPNLPLSYLFAARQLLQGGDDVVELVRPIAYLQRHALELGLKRLIDVANELFTNDIWIAALESKPGTPQPFCQSAPPIHDLKKLVKEAHASLERIGRSLPDELAQWAERLSALEDNSPDRWRYSQQRNGKPSFPERVRIPIHLHQRNLEKLFGDHLWFQGFDEAELPSAPLLAQLVLRAWL